MRTLLRRAISFYRDRAANTRRTRLAAESEPALEFDLLDSVDSATERLLVIADALGATQHISLVAPLAKRRSRGETALAILSEANLDRLSGAAAMAQLSGFWEAFRPTAVIVSRAATRQIGLIVRQCRQTKTPLVAHLDDDLFAVPLELGADKAAHHNAPARLARLTIACRRADLIYASTPVLADRLLAKFPDKRVWTSRIYAAAREPFARYSPGPERVFGYMGTAGHGADLAAIAPAIEAVLQRFPDVRFETFGTIQPPDILARFGDRVRAHGRTKDYASFLAKMPSLGWMAGLAPLLPTEFNACKADTKFVEYAQAGIPPVLARHLVYRRPLTADAAMGAATIEEWTESICALLEDRIRGGGLVQAAQEHLRVRYARSILEQDLKLLLVECARCGGPQNLAPYGHPTGGEVMALSSANVDRPNSVKVVIPKRQPNASASAEFPFKPPYDPRFAERVPLVQTFRAALTYALTAHTQVKKKDGAFWVAECGVYRGRALRALAHIADELKCPVRIVGLDSFEGLPDLTATDVLNAPKGARYTREVLFADTTEREVMAYLEDVNRENRIRLVKGFFSDTLPTLPEQRYAFVNIDCDLYEGHLQCLEYFYPRMLEGGVIFLDDYHSQVYPMARIAVDEFLADKPETVFTVSYGADGTPKAYLVKA